MSYLEILDLKPEAPNDVSFVKIILEKTLILGHLGI